MPKRPCAKACTPARKFDSDAFVVNKDSLERVEAWKVFDW